ncbi:MAG: glycosyltransferase [Lachnospiraceae bacterium]|nr:glycosyltransferase [Lachnospiraceae bacterium]
MQDKEKKQKKVMLMVPLLDQGGLERICAFTAKCLNDKCELCLVVFSTKNMFYDIGDVELIDLGLGSRPTKPGKIINVFKRVHAVKKIKRQRQIDITYSFGPTANLVNVLSRVKDKIWVGIRGYGALQSDRNMRLLCKKADTVICCTKIMRDDVNAIYHPKEAECLYNPCETEKNRQMSREAVEERHMTFFDGSSPIIVSMSRADDVKGFWHLIKAVALIKREIPEVKLMIIGDGDFSEYEKLAVELGIGNDVLFTGLQKNPFTYLEKASLYAMCSYTEGFPNSLVEAMSVGLPVIAANCKTGPAEILSEDYKKVEDQKQVHECEYGILVPLMNPVKNLDASVVEEEERIFAKEAVKILKNPEYLIKLQERAQKRSDTFSADQYIEKLVWKIEQV